MNDIIKYYVQSLSQATETLKKKSILLEKPWALVDNDGAIQKLIFSKDNKLILSKNGVVTEGSWNYHPEARSLFIDRGADKLLLNEQYIDENVLILKKDGTDNEFFALANENTVPDYDVPKYLFSIKCKLNAIKIFQLSNNNTIHYSSHKLKANASIGTDVSFLENDYTFSPVPDGAYMTKDREHTIYVSEGNITAKKKNIFFRLIDGKELLTHPNEFDERGTPLGNWSEAHIIEDDHVLVKLPTGSYMTKDKEFTFLVKDDGKIGAYKKNLIFSSPEGISCEIEGIRGYSDYFEENRFLNQKITVNGNPVSKERILYDQNTVYKIENSIIVQVLFIREYRLTHNFNIKVEHKDDPKFKKGDLIINSDPVHPIPAGKYRVKGKLKWIRVENGVII